MAKPGGLALGLVLLVFLGAIAIPAAVENVDDNEIQSEQLSIGETFTFNSQIDVSLVDSSNTQATIRIVDEETGESFDAVISEENTSTFAFSNGDVHVTNSISNNNAATLLVEFPSIFGYNPAARQVGDNLATILVGMFFVAIMAFVGVKSQ